MPSEQQLSEDYGGESEPLPESLWQWLSEAGAAKPDNLALVVDNQDKSTITWTYRQLMDRVEKLASYLTERDVKSGDTVFTFIDNYDADAWAVLFWTSIRLGLTFAPEDPHTLGRAEETRKLIETLQPTVVIVQDFDTSRQYEEYDQSPKVKLLCNELSKGGTSSSWLPIHAILDAESSFSPAPQHDPPADSTVLVMNTSGSTSLPKCCPVSVRAFVTQTRQYHSFHRSNYTSRTRTLNISQVYRPVCYLGCINTWQRGGTAVFCGRDLDEKKTVEMVRKWEVTHTWTMPSMVNLMSSYIDGLADVKSAKEALKTLEFVMMSGDASDLSTGEKAKRFLPDSCKFTPHWGMSEGAPLFGFTSEEPLHLDEGSKIVGSGRELRGTRLRVCKSRTTTPVPRATQGEFHVSSDSSIKHYLENRNAEDFYDDDHGRWFTTGDIAKMDESGVVYIIGRTKDIIVYKGRNVVPAVMESCLKEEFPAMEPVCIGLDYEMHGALPTVVFHGVGVEKEEINKLAMEKLGAWAAPAGGIYRLEDLGIDAWPMNSSNKIDKRELVRLVSDVRQ